MLNLVRSEVDKRCWHRLYSSNIGANRDARRHRRQVVKIYIVRPNIRFGYLTIRRYWWNGCSVDNVGSGGSGLVTVWQAVPERIVPLRICCPSGCADILGLESAYYIERRSVGDKRVGLVI